MASLNKVVVWLFSLSLSDWADIGTIGGTIFIGLSVFYLARQIRASPLESARTRTAHVLARFNQPAFRKQLGEVQQYLYSTAGGQAEDHLDQDIWRGDDSFRTGNTGTVWSFFEEVGILYRMGLLDKKIVREFFQTLSLELYRWSEPLINRLRQYHHNPFFCREWELLNDEIKDWRARARHWNTPTAE